MGRVHGEYTKRPHIVWAIGDQNFTDIRLNLKNKRPFRPINK